VCWRGNTAGLSLFFVWGVVFVCRGRDIFDGREGVFGIEMVVFVWKWGDFESEWVIIG